MSQPLDRLVADNLDIWSSATLRKSGAGRGGGKRISLYGLERLRALILDLAVRGKLVPQDAGDEDANTLLERISRTRKLTGRRLKATKNSIKHTIMHGKTVPPSWENPPLIEIAEIQQGFAFSAGQFSLLEGTGVPLIKIGDIGANEPDTFYSGDFEDRYFVSSGDILVGLSGSIKCAIWTGRDALLNQRIARVRPVSDDVVLSWLYLAINSKIEKWKNETSSFTVKNLKSDQLNQEAIPLPPLPEQRRIVAKVDELMALCDALELESVDAMAAHTHLVEELLATLVNSASPADLAANWARLETHFDTLFTTDASIEAFKQTILDLAVRGRLVEQDARDEPAGALLARSANAMNASVQVDRFRAPTKILPTKASEAVPDNWVATRLGALVRIINGKAYKKTELLTAGKPVLRVGNLFTSNDWYYSDLDLDDDKYIDDGDLIYAWSASFGPFIWNGGRVIYHYHIWKLEPFSETDVSREFLRLFLANETAAIKAAGHGIAMLHMTKERMEQLPVPIPPLAEQHRIVAKVDALMALCDALKARLADAAQTQRHLADAIIERAAA